MCEDPGMSEINHSNKVSCFLKLCIRTFVNNQPNSIIVCVRLKHQCKMYIFNEKDYGSSALIQN